MFEPIADLMSRPDPDLQRRRHPRPRHQAAGEGRADLVRRCLGGGAGNRAKRRQPFPDAAPAAAHPSAFRAALRSTARRPTACCWRAANPDGPQPDSGAVGRQSRRQSGRGRDLFGHGGGGDGRHAAGRSLHRLLSQFFEDRQPVKWATAEHWAPEVIRRLCSIGWPRNVLINVNFPDVAAWQRRWHRGRPPGQAQASATS